MFLEVFVKTEVKEYCICTKHGWYYNTLNKNFHKHVFMLYTSCATILLILSILFILLSVPAHCKGEEGQARINKTISKSTHRF